MAENEDKSVVIDVRAESEHLQSDLSAAARKVKKSSNEMAQSQAKAGDETVKKHKRDSEEKQKHTASVEKKEKEANQNIKEDSSRTGDAVVKKHGEDSERLKKQTEGVGKHAKETGDEVGKHTKDTGDEVVKKHGEDVEKLKKQTDDYKEKAKKAASDIGKAFLSIGTAAAAGSTAAIVSAAKDQTSFAKVKTLLSADTNPEAYADAIKAASRETGVNFGALSESVYSAISASVDEKSAVSFTADAVKLAKGGFTDAATSVDVLTTAINAYSLSAEDASHISDVLITAQNEGKTTVNELASSMGQTIPIANSAGAVIEDLAAQYAVLTKNGVATAEAGTGIKAMLSELNSAGSNISKTLKEISGKSFSELQADGKSSADILNILGDYAASSGKKLSDLFGSVEAGSAALTIVKDGGEDFNRILEKMENSAGATEKAYQTMSDTVEERFEKLKNRFMLGVSETGEKILPYVEDFFDYVDEHSDEFESAIEDAGKLLLEFSKTLGEVVKIGWEYRDVLLIAGAAFGGWKLGQVVSDILKFGKALTSAAAAGGGFTSVLQTAGAKAALVTAAIAALTEEFNWLKQGFTVSEDVQKLADSVDDLKGSVEEAEASFAAETAVLKTKAQAYEELRTKTDRTAAEEERLSELADELQEKLGGNCTVVNALTGEYNDLTQAVDDYIKKQSASVRMSALEEQAKEAYKLIDEIEEKMEERSKKHEEWVENWNNTPIRLTDAAAYVETNNFLNDMAALRDSKEEAEQIIADYEAEFGKYMQGISGDSETAEKTVQQSAAASSKSLEEITQAAQDCRKATGELSAEAKNLSSAFAEQNEDGSLSVDTILSLVDAGYAAALAVDAETGAVRLSTEAYKELAQAKIEAQKADLLEQRAQATKENIEKMKAASGSGDYKRIAELQAENEAIVMGYDVQIAALDQIDLNKVTGGAYGNQRQSGSGKTTAQKGTTKTTETEPTEAEKNAEKYAQKKKDLDYRRSMDEIDDTKYYKTLGEYRDTYLEKDSDAWRSANVAIHDYEKSQKENAEKSAEKSSAASKGTVISIDSYIPTLWDDEEETNRKLREGLGIELTGNSQTGKRFSIESPDAFSEAASLSPSTSAVNASQSTSEATLSDVLKELRELKETDTKRKISLDVDLYARDLAIGSISIPDINEIAKQTGRNPFSFM